MTATDGGASGFHPVPRELVAAVAAALVDRHPAVVGLTGSVAVGKTTLAAALAEALHPDSMVVGTDGFLHSNRVLDAQGTLERKGFPESFDVAALHRFVDSVRNGLDPLPVPVYDHVTYDIAADPLLISPAPPIVVLEGVFLPPDLDLVVYLDAEEGHIIEWFVARFMQLRDAARTDPASFYCRFLPMSDAAAIDIAHQVWDGINGPNLHRHIAPQRDRADIVVTKRSDHRVSRVDVRDKPPL